MSKRTAPKLTASPNKPKRTFKTVQVRPEVLVLLSQVQDLFAEINQGVRPQNSITFVNSLLAYRTQLQANAISTPSTLNASGTNGQH